jgi:hypothetical protein
MKCENIPNIPFEDFVEFLRKSLRCWPRKFHNWTDREQKVFEQVCSRVEDFIYLEESTSRQIGEVMDGIEKGLDIVVPIAYGTFSDIYFKNWSLLVKNWDLEYDG